LGGTSSLGGGNGALQMRGGGRRPFLGAALLVGKFRPSVGKTAAWATRAGGREKEIGGSGGTGGGAGV